MSAFPSDTVLAVLHVTAAAEEPLRGYEIGNLIMAVHVAAGGRGPGQRGPRYIGPGAIAYPAIRSAINRGWLHAMFVSVHERTDTAYKITPEGVAAAARFPDPRAVL